MYWNADSTVWNFFDICMSVIHGLQYVYILYAFAYL